ncbi:hypothetical protein [Phytobacter sp. AG2a]
MINDFESVSFHDNAIHGFYLPENLSEETSPLCFDIDHIIEWTECSSSGEVIFSVCQGIISFYDVTDLKINITWSNSNYSASEVGLYILDIKRTTVKTPLRLPQYYRWEIITNNSNYHFSFAASSMSIILIGDAKKTERQYLLADERESIRQFIENEPTRLIKP